MGDNSSDIYPAGIFQYKGVAGYILQDKMVQFKYTVIAMMKDLENSVK